MLGTISQRVAGLDPSAKVRKRGEEKADPLIKSPAETLPQNTQQEESSAKGEDS